MRSAVLGSYPSCSWSGSNSTPQLRQFRPCRDCHQPHQYHCSSHTGSLLAFHLYPRIVDFRAYRLPIRVVYGSSDEWTAFRYLPILSERGLIRTEVGTLTIACAAVDDASLGALFAAIVAVVRSESSQSLLWQMLVGLATYFAFMRLWQTFSSGVSPIDPRQQKYPIR